MNPNSQSIFEQRTDATSAEQYFQVWTKSEMKCMLYIGHMFLKIDCIYIYIYIYIYI